ncbi:DUF2550 family protein [Isoptericola sp. b441]|uniref:DUF2550 family protein n=1 Tax=Actinotalea lenta TaxID=3064654 RepID=A0ABT9DF85_9CELL|nr:MULTISPECIES: DUF2550 family protein [unclassified Isoptericola]MDO8108267.1 DUF2550 family protein [Isoptericola sp. b441]MDO8120059.1 DUF2550 family protein [Isoptericola sp. b490]
MEVELLVGLGVLLVALLLLAALIVRQRALTHRVGSFGCRWAPDPALPLVRTSGMAAYGTGRLDWWRLVSLARRPSRSWSRDRLEIIERHEVPETDDRGRPMVQVHCRHESEEFLLTMTSPAYAGLVSWLEARPRRSRAF